MNRLLITLVIAVATMSPAARSQTVLFEDDFSGGTWDPAWVSKWCCQRVVDGWLYSQDTDGWPRDALAVVHDGDTAWTDYDVSLDAEFVPGTGWKHYNIVLRSNGFDRSSAGSSGSAYQLEFVGAPWEPAIALSRFHGRSVELYRGRWNPPAGPAALTISLKGGRLSLSVNGESVFDVIDPDPLPYGGIGLHTIWESKARFDNVVVTAAPVAALPWLAALGDLMGDGTQHLAVLFADAAAGTVTAQIKQATTGTLIQTLLFDQGYAPLDLAVVPDQNANGAPELALLGRHAANGSVQVEVRDTLTGERLSAVAFNPLFAPQRLAVLPNRNGNGAAALAVLGINAGNGAIAAEIKDAATGAGLGKVFFAKTFQPVDFAAVADANGNGAAELAVLGVNSEGQPRVELRDSAGAALVKVLWSPKWTTPLNLAELPDANGNGTPEVAVLGRGRGGAVLVKTADAGTAVQLGFVFYNRNFTPHQMAALPDLNANGVAELAVLGHDAGNQLKTELRDAVTGALVRNLWFDHLAPLDLAALPDMNGNGSPEVAVLGVSAAGGVQVLIKDSATQAEVNRLDF